MRRALSVLVVLTIAMWMGAAGAQEPPKGQGQAVTGTAATSPAKKHTKAKHHKAKTTKKPTPTQPGEAK